MLWAEIFLGINDHFIIHLYQAAIFLLRVKKFILLFLTLLQEPCMLLLAFKQSLVGKQWQIWIFRTD